MENETAGGDPGLEPEIRSVRRYLHGTEYGCSLWFRKTYKERGPGSACHWMTMHFVTVIISSLEESESESS